MLAIEATDSRLTCLRLIVSKMHAGGCISRAARYAAGGVGHYGTPWWQHALPAFEHQPATLQFTRPAPQSCMQGSRGSQLWHATAVGQSASRSGKRRLPLA